MDVVNRHFEREDAMQNTEYREALVSLLYQLADDDLILGHRDSEWLGVAPEIEEDIAFSSIAQDEVGHATFYYDLLAELGEGHRDELAYARPASSRKNAVLVERENGDWAFSICRHLFYDTFESLRLDALKDSSYSSLGFGAVKIHREEFYHLLHHRTVFKALATPGTEARVRLQSAVTELWEDALSLFDFGPHEEKLFEFGILTIHPTELKRRWLLKMTELFEEVNLDLPTTRQSQDTKRDSHTEALERLLSVMCEVYALDTSATW